LVIPISSHVCIARAVNEGVCDMFRLMTWFHAFVFEGRTEQAKQKKAGSVAGLAYLNAQEDG
jgi:hypothetical protein